MELEMDGALMTSSDIESTRWGGTTRGRTLLKSNYGFCVKFCGRSKPVIHYTVFITTKEKTSQVSLFSKWISIYLLFMTLPIQLTYAFLGNGAKNNCFYFITSTSDTRLFSMIPITASEMPDIGINNVSTFHIAITGKLSYHEPWIIPQADGITGVAFTHRVFRGVIYISTGKSVIKLCR